MPSAGFAYARWEKFRFNPPPSLEQLDALAVVVGVEGDGLQGRLPPPGVEMKLEPPRLCGACYAQSPCHKMEWPFKGMQGCERHKLRFLSECSNCGARFKVPALWTESWCQRCFMSLGQIAEYQKSCTVTNYLSLITGVQFLLWEYHLRCG
jgi:hypothetical protein